MYKELKTHQEEKLMTPLKKWVRDLNDFTREDIWMANKLMKMSSTS